jgi:hypothetical protein
MFLTHIKKAFGSWTRSAQQLKYILRILLTYTTTQKIKIQKTGL